MNSELQDKLTEIIKTGTKIKLLRDVDFIYEIEKYELHKIHNLNYTNGHSIEFIAISNKDNHIILIQVNYEMELQVTFHDRNDIDKLTQFLVSNKLATKVTTNKKLLYMYAYGWCRDHEHMESRLASLTIPKKYKTVTSPYLYRGLSLSKSALKKLQKTGCLKLKPRICTSWATNIQMADEYREGGNGIVKVHTDSASVVLKLGALFPKYDV